MSSSPSRSATSPPPTTVTAPASTTPPAVTVAGVTVPASPTPLPTTATAPGPVSAVEPTLTKGQLSQRARRKREREAKELQKRTNYMIPIAPMIIPGTPVAFRSPPSMIPRTPVMIQSPHALSQSPIMIPRTPIMIRNSPVTSQSSPLGTPITIRRLPVTNPITPVPIRSPTVIIQERSTKLVTAESSRKKAKVTKNNTNTPTPGQLFQTHSSTRPSSSRSAAEKGKRVANLENYPQPNFNIDDESLSNGYDTVSEYGTSNYYPSRLSPNRGQASTLPFNGAGFVPPVIEDDIVHDEFDDDRDNALHFVAEHPMGRHSLGRMNSECPSCGALHWIDERLKTGSIRSPKYGSCCLEGKILLENLLTPPPALKDLFDSPDRRAKRFRDNIREYNNAMAFTSLGVNQALRVVAGRGPMPFKILGELRHRTGGLTPEGSDRQASYAQLYIYDPNQALGIRTDRNPDLDADVLRIIQEVLLQNNPFVEKFRQAHEILKERDNAGRPVSAHLHFRAATKRHRYNLPTMDEIAVILPGDGTERSRTRDIVLHLRSNQALERISECHAAYLPLHYVLFFPFGELGWTDGLWKYDPVTKELTDKRLTRNKWFAYRLFERRGEYSSILRGKKLFQEFVVDAWAATEQNRLTWIRENQTKLRADLYKGLVENAADGLQANETGKVILPATHTGSARQMFGIYQDSMAITRYYSHPDIFVTMTANPNWQEITEALLDGQTAFDRPDITARVFEQKRRALMKDIKTMKVFGKYVASVYTIEFQKRGLPHMHALIFLSSEDKIRNADDVDMLISAELPDKCSDPELYETITRCMIHGPCGARNMSAPCMKDGICTKKYPRDFTETTTMGQDGYPTYRRRDIRRFTRSGHEISNRDVVPYNPFLTRRFNCHINVEVCAGIRCVKYIHKYIYKGHDRATMVIGDGDEIKEYIDSRYIGPSEAVYRILEYNLHKEKPKVEQLEIHLPGFHHVVYRADEPMDVVIQRARTQRSKLTAFFDLCARSAFARKFTYQEIPNKHTWKANIRQWTERQGDFAIGRMHFASPNSGEKFYLRLLLSVVKGPTSFENLRTVDGVLHHTFKAAAHALGLLEDDSEWAECLQEASLMKTGYQLRRLFAVLLSQCNLLNPEELWNKYSVNICDDLAHRLRTSGGILNPTEAEVLDYGLFLLNEILTEYGKDLSDFPPMPLPVRHWANIPVNRLLEEHHQLYQDAVNSNPREHVDMLNSRQRLAFDEIIGSVTNQRGKIFFLNGGAGTGKTFLYNTIANICRADNKIVITVASSGIAALLLIGGRTAHSTFGIPIKVDESTICSVTKQSKQAEVLKRAELIIWDEVAMQNRLCIEAVDRLLKDLRDDGRPFGGITVVLGGDFRQILPVIEKGTREQVVAATVQRSTIWSHVHVLTLDVNMRLTTADEENRAYARFLQQIGSSPLEIIQLPDQMHKCYDIDSLITKVYPQVHDSRVVTAEYLTNRIILSARNDDVNAINKAVLEKVRGELKTLLAADTVPITGTNNRRDYRSYTNEIVNTLNPSGIPPFKLELKVGAPVILLRNLAPKQGLCNGTRLMIIRCGSRIIEAQILTGDKAGTNVLIPRISLSPSNNELPIEFTRRQFPIRLAYALTINKAQGQSVKFVGVDLRTEVFSHGQLYVALSRCTDFHSISVLLPNKNSNNTANIVYPEVLL